MSVTLQILLQKYDRRLLIPATEACADIGWSVSKYHNRKSLKVEFPIKLLREEKGRAHFVRITDLADYIDNLGGPDTKVLLTADGKVKDPKKGGRPTKAEAAAKRAEQFARMNLE